MRNIVLLTILIALMSISCSRNNTGAQNNSTSDKPRIVVNIITNSSSDFKSEIIDSLRATYQDIADVQVRNIKKAHELDKNAEINIVMDQLKAWLWMNGTFKKLLKESDPQKTIFLMTSGEDKWVYKGQQDIVITAASRKYKADATITEVKSRIDKILINMQ